MYDFLPYWSKKILIFNTFRVQGNVGDSRAVICCSGQAEALSTDHKPANESESKRITAAGGFVEFNRVNGTVSVPSCGYEAFQ